MIERERVMHKKLFFLLISLSLMGGCATSVKVKNMVPKTDDLVFTSTGKTLNVDRVKGGEDDSFWTGSKISAANFQSALFESLQKSNIFSDVQIVQVNKAADYKLIAHVMSQEQPAFGINMTVTLKVVYQIFETATDAKVYDKLIAAKYTATFGSALAGSARLIKANEGAVRENIKSFLSGLARARL